MSAQDKPATLADFRIAYYERQVARVVEDLRSLVDRVEREARPHATASLTDTPRHMNAADAANHALVWGIAEIGAHRLYDAAFHADVAEKEAKA